MKVWRVAAAVAALVVSGPVHTLAWGATGHEIISGIAMDTLPEMVPAFLRAPGVAGNIAVLGREPDRSKGAGRTHDAERDPGHWISLADDGSVAGILPLDALPPTREAYDALLRAGGSTQYKAGYLFYEIVDGWQQLVKDFAYWRALTKAIETAQTPDERTWFQADRRLRELLILRDLGIWSHYPGDASQPLHASIHYDGWAHRPNRENYTTRNVSAYIQGAFVRSNIKRQAVLRLVDAYKSCVCSIEDRARDLLRLSLAQVEPLYRLEKAGAFRDADPRGIEFIASRLAAGATATRDMIADAWIASATAMVGYPMVSVRDIESGKLRATRALFGAD